MLVQRRINNYEFDKRKLGEDCFGRLCSVLVLFAIRLILDSVAYLRTGNLAPCNQEATREA